MRVNDHRVRHVREPIAGEQDVLRPLDVFADRCRAKRMALPDRSADARAHVVERAALEPRHRREPSSSRVVGDCDGCAPCRTRPTQRAEVLAGDRAGVGRGSWRANVPASGSSSANGAISAASQASEAGTASCTSSTDQLAARRFDPQVAGQTVVERVRRNADEPIDASAEQLRRAVGRARIDRDDLDRTVDALARERLEQRRQRRRAVARRQHDRDRELRTIHVTPRTPGATAPATSAVETLPLAARPRRSTSRRGTVRGGLREVAQPLRRCRSGCAARGQRDRAATSAS